MSDAGEFLRPSFVLVVATVAAMGLIRTCVTAEGLHFGIENGWLRPEARFRPLANVGNWQLATGAHCQLVASNLLPHMLYKR